MAKEKKEKVEKKILGTKVRMTETAACPDYVLDAGKEYTLDRKLADELVKAGSAVPAKAVKETADKKPEENAAKE